MGWLDKLLCNHTWMVKSNSHHVNEKPFSFIICTDCRATRKVPGNLTKGEAYHK